MPKKSQHFLFSNLLYKISRDFLEIQNMWVLVFDLGNIFNILFIPVHVILITLIYNITNFMHKDVIMYMYKVYVKCV